jgi:hypothetical protein
MRAGETELVMATRHVAEQEGRIVRQEFLVTHLQAVEAPLDDALDLLASMYDLLEDMRDHVESWPALSGQISSPDKWSLCRFADVGVARREGVARPERRRDNGGEIHAAATCGRCS